MDSDVFISDTQLKHNCLAHEKVEVQLLILYKVVQEANASMSEIYFQALKTSNQDRIKSKN